MTNQTLIWTILPNGIETAAKNQYTLRLSVLVSPRLEPTNVAEQKSTLSLFPDFINWPKQLQTVSFQVQFGSGLTLSAQSVTDGLDPELWSLLFPAKTFVRPYTFEDLSGAKFLTFPSQKLLDLLKEVYTITALEYGVDKLPLGYRQNHYQEEYARDENYPNTGWDQQLFPSERPLSREDRAGLLSRALRVVARRRVQWQEDIDRAIEKFGIYISDSPTPSPTDLLQFQGFHLSTVPSDSPPVPDFDFHDILALLGDYPELQRKLGLIIDLRIALPPGQVLPTTDIIRVVPAWTPQLADTVNKFPLTQYQLILQGLNFGFRASPRPTNPELKDGFLDVQTEGFSVVPVDVDGALFKLTETEANILNATKSQLLDAPNDFGIPSLRSAGLSLVHRHKAPLLKLNVETSAQLNLAMFPMSPGNEIPPKTPPKNLYAEDLVRGYRIDVWDAAAKQWFSLCEREGEYRFVDANGTVVRKLPILEAGIVDSAVTEEIQDKKTYLKVPESLFRWEGWSLVAPRPDVPLAAPKEENAPEDPAVPYQLDVVVRAKSGTLPRLRFGREYRIRVRAVDLAGNSVAFSEQSKVNECATQPIRYYRFEPISSPALVLRSEVTDGEALEHLVIRSNFNVNTQTYASQHLVTKYPAITERHVAPPKIGQLTAETHGKFDYAFSGLNLEAKKKAQAMAYRISRKEKGTFDDKEVVNTENISNPESAPLTVPVFPEIILVPNPAGDLRPDKYTIHRTENLLLPYLPDPLALGVAFTNLPHSELGKVALLEPRDMPTSQTTFTALSRSTGGLLAKRILNTPSSNNLVNLQLPLPRLIPFDGEWPNLKPFRLQLVEGSAAPDYDPKTRVLTVSLEKAEVRKVRMSCYIDKAGRELMGIWQWIRDNIQNSESTKASDYGLHGQHWLLTPYRELTLVHAVQQPIEPPVLKFSDPPIKDVKPGTNSKLGVTAARLTMNIRLHSRSTSKLDLMATWRESRDVPAEGRPLYQYPDPNKEPGQLNVMIDERVTMQTQVSEEPIKYRQNEIYRSYLHEFNDTKYRQVSYFAKATSRFREYFLHKSLEKADFTRTGNLVTVEILNSARPQAPRVAQVVPIFRWENSTTPSGVVHIRRGNGLRVYLERPWFSSGDGEKLAVVMAKSSFASITDNEKGYFTQWAEDPIYYANPVYSDKLNLHYFPGKALVEKPLPELPKEKALVDVVGHEVYFNEERNQWYADITLTPGASSTLGTFSLSTVYFPFVRLALARYQPNSEKDAHLSTVVLSDFVQTVPDRMIVTQKDALGNLLISITGPGALVKVKFKQLNSTSNITLTASNLMVVHLEQASLGLNSDLLFSVVKSSSPLYLMTKPAKGSQSSLLIWSGNLTVPAANPALTYRVVVREWETTNELFDKGNIYLMVENSSLEQIETVLRTYSRVVFTDVVDL